MFIQVTTRYQGVRCFININTIKAVISLDDKTEIRYGYDDAVSVKDSAEEIIANINKVRFEGDHHED